MNRAERRANHRKAPPAVRAVASNYQCPDCLSETTHPAVDELGIWHIEVHHDDTCPLFAAYRAAGLA
jgi:hypothetical protein